MTKISSIYYPRTSIQEKMHLQFSPDL